MTTYAYAVKVRSHRWSNRRRWEWACPICHTDGHPVRMSVTRVRAHREATHHAATCEALHWANRNAACPSCASYGRISPACPRCLGYGTLPRKDSEMTDIKLELIREYAAKAGRIYAERTAGDLTWEGLLGDFLAAVAGDLRAEALEDFARFANRVYRNRLVPHTLILGDLRERAAKLRGTDQ